MTRIEDVYRITKARYDNVQRLYELESDLHGENRRYVEMLRDEMNVLFGLLDIIKSEEHARDIAHLYHVDMTDEIYLVITEYINRPSYDYFVRLETHDIEQAKEAARIFAADDKPEGFDASRTFICRKIDWELNFESGYYEEFDYKEEADDQ